MPDEEVMRADFFFDFDFSCVCPTAHPFAMLLKSSVSVWIIDFNIDPTCWARVLSV